MFGRNKDNGQPRGKLATWLHKIFGDKDEPNRAVEAFSLDTPEESTENDVQDQSRMTEEYKEFLREQEKTWPQEVPAAEEAQATETENTPDASASAPDENA